MPMGWCRVLAVSVLVLAGRSTVSAQLLPPEERGRALSSAEAGPPSIPGVHVRSVEEFYELDEPTLTQVVARLNHTHLEGPPGALVSAVHTAALLKGTSKPFFFF